MARTAGSTRPGPFRWRRPPVTTDGPSNSRSGDYDRRVSESPKDAEERAWHAPFAWAPPPTDWMPPPPMIVEPAVLSGQLVRLEPLDDRHIPGLMRAGANLDLWRWTVEWLDTPEKLRAYL